MEAVILTTQENGKGLINHKHYLLTSGGGIAAGMEGVEFRMLALVPELGVETAME